MSDRDPDVHVGAFRELPHNIAAEKGLLGSILIENRAYDAVGEYLRPEHFVLLAHGDIFAACREIIGRGGTADPISLETVLKESAGKAALKTAEKSTLVTHRSLVVGAWAESGAG